MTQQNDRSKSNDQRPNTGQSSSKDASRSTEKDAPAGTSVQRGEVPPQGDARRGTDRNDRQNAEQHGRDWSNPPGESRDTAPRAGSSAQGQKRTNDSNEDSTNPNRDMDANRRSSGKGAGSDRQAAKGGQSNADSAE